MPKICRPWVRSEDVIVERSYPDYLQAARLLPNRTPRAIRDRARKLGVTRHRVAFLAADVARLRRLWETGPARELVLTAFPAWTWQQIKDCAKRNKMGSRFKPKGTRHPLVGAVRQRASERGVTRHDLDRKLRTGNYFRNPQKPYLPHELRAADFLGVQYDIEWEET